MKIVYDMSVDDYVAFSLFTIVRSPSCRRRVLLSGLIIPVIMFAIVFGLSISSGDWVSICVAAVIFGSISLWGFGGNRRRVEKVNRRLLKEGANKSLLGRHELEIDKSGLAVRAPLSERKIMWGAVERIALTPDYCFVYIGAIEALIVPRRNILPEDFESLMREIEEGFRGAASIDGLTFDEKKIVRNAKPIFKCERK